MDKKSELFDLLTKKPNEGLSRRDAIKLMGISPVAAAVIASTATSTEAEAATDVKGKIVILGGGAGGIMAMAHLNSKIKSPDITIIAPNEIHLYQPGQVFIATGVYQPDDIIMNNNDFIPKDVNWIKDEAKTIDADNNKITLRNGDEVSYDYLVVATGIKYHYEWIDGLKEEDIGTNGISSVYLSDLEKGTALGGSTGFTWLNQLKDDTKAGKKPRAIFTQPATPIKCGGAPQKMLCLCADYLKKENLHTEFIFTTAGGKLFSLKNVEEELQRTQDSYEGMSTKFKHNLTSIDVQNKKATFHYIYNHTDEWGTESREEDVILDYDYIHIVPPMTPVDAVVNSSLAWQEGKAKGWLEVDKFTLQHKRYENVFGIGDVCGIPMGKTGGSARHHAPIMAKNLISQMAKKALKEKFDGYTVCPLKPRFGEIIMAEFGYDGPMPSIPFWKDISVPRSSWWIFDVYMLKPMYKHLMMRGLM